MTLYWVILLLQKQAHLKEITFAYIFPGFQIDTLLFY
jgi:hypothetical protein